MTAGANKGLHGCRRPVGEGVTSGATKTSEGMAVAGQPPLSQLPPVKRSAAGAGGIHKPAFQQEVTEAAERLRRWQEANRAVLTHTAGGDQDSQRDEAATEGITSRITIMITKCWHATPTATKGSMNGAPTQHILGANTSQSVLLRIHEIHRMAAAVSGR
jgi:hypothetical protein